MILENSTHYATEDLEALILRVLEDAGITKHGRDRVRVAYSRDGKQYTGWCFYGSVKPMTLTERAAFKRRMKGLGTVVSSRRENSIYRMRLNVPRPEHLDLAKLIWLVRHEVAHWQGLSHAQMGPTLMHHDPTAPTPAWCGGWRSLRVLEERPAEIKKRKPTADDTREKRIEHARKMLAKASRRAKLAATLEAKWRRKLSALERVALRVAAGRV